MLPILSCLRVRAAWYIRGVLSCARKGTLDTYSTLTNAFRMVKLHQAGKLEQRQEAVETQFRVILGVYETQPSSILIVAAAGAGVV
jgi:hypothetical protein